MTYDLGDTLDSYYKLECSIKLQKYKLQNELHGQLQRLIDFEERDWLDATFTGLVAEDVEEALALSLENSNAA